MGLWRVECQAEEITRNRLVVFFQNKHPGLNSGNLLLKKIH